MANWQNVDFEIPREPDRMVLRSALETLRAGEINSAEVLLIPVFGGQPLACQLSELDGHAQIQSILAAEQCLVREFRFRIPKGPSLLVQRASNGLRDKVVLDLTELNQPKAHGSQEQLLKLAIAAKKTFPEVLAQHQLEYMGKLVSEHYEVREANLARLESTLSNILEQFGRDVAQQRQTMEAEFAEHRRRADDEVRKEKDRLEAEFGVKNAEIEGREEALKARIAEIDDRDARHVRRNIREDMKKELAARAKTFELTEGTRRLRQPVFVSSVVLLVAFAAGLVYYSVQTATAGASVELLVILAIKSAAFAVAFGSTAVFFIRWNNRWFEQHASEEFKLKRMALDLDRASWVVEMVLELGREKDAAIPPELLQRLTQNLFAEPHAEDVAAHPADQLASAILGTSAEVSLELPGGGSIKLDRKSLRELAKTKGGVSN